MSRRWTTIRGRREADLRGRLKQRPGRRRRRASRPPPEMGEPPADGEDYQLSRALDLLRGISLYEGRALAGSKG